MRYVGGKVRIARWVSEHLLEYGRDCERYLEPFMGGGAVMEKMAPHFQGACFGSDAHPDLIMMWQALLDGWEPPTWVSREDYQRLKSEASSALRGLVGFGGSFGGKWFGGYVDTAWDEHHQRFTKPYLRAATLSVKKTATILRESQVGLTCSDYQALAAQPGDLIYCDPPYANTLGYSTGRFDHDQFWAQVRSWTQLGARVIVSESQAPPDFRPWALRQRKGMFRATKGTEQVQRIEALYIYAP